MNQPPRKDDGPRVNERIIADEIRLVGDDGEMIGVVSVEEGLKKADEAGLDTCRSQEFCTPAA